MENNYTIEEMESFLPARMGRSGSKKSQTLLVAELLRTFTDSEHGLTASEIREVVGLRSGRRPSESKVLDDIHEIAENRPFGTDVEIPERGETTGFRCTKTFITSDQARLLINMVQTCKFITPEQRMELCEALHSMVSYHQQDRIVESVHVDERELPTRQDVFEAADVVYKAIKSNKKLSFRYSQRNLHGNEFVIRSASGDQMFEETPIALVYSFGNYYVETWEESQGKRYARRLDKIRDARVSCVDANIDKKIRQLRATVQERLSQTFDMWGDDTPRTLFLLVQGRGIGYTYDRFGPNIAFHDIDLKNNCGCLCADVQLGPTFYRWLFGMKGLVRIARPKSGLWVSQFAGDRHEGIKPFEGLVEDYEAAMRGFWEHINECCNAYGFALQKDVTCDEG